MLKITLTDFADLSQVVIGLSSLFLAGYIFIYQRNRDKSSELAAARLNEQNIRLQWFKELVVQPHITLIDQFYSRLQSIKEMIDSNDMKTEEKENINAFIKKQASEFRKGFIDLLVQLDKNFGEQVLKNIDDLTDGLTEAIFNDDLKLTRSSVFEKNISSKISYSKNSLIKLLFSYKGM